MREWWLSYPLIIDGFGIHQEGNLGAFSDSVCGWKWNWSSGAVVKLGSLCPFSSSMRFFVPIPFLLQLFISSWMLLSQTRCLLCRINLQSAIFILLWRWKTFLAAAEVFAWLSITYNWQSNNSNKREWKVGLVGHLIPWIFVLTVPFTVWPQESYFRSLPLSFIICKIRRWETWFLSLLLSM